MAAQTSILRSPISGVSITRASFPSRNPHPQLCNYFSAESNSYYKPRNLTLSRKTPLKPYLLVCSSNNSPSPSALSKSTRPALISINTSRPHLAESTRTVSTLIATAILISKLFGHAISNYVQGVWKLPGPNQLLNVQGFQENMMTTTTSPLFFAAVKIHRQQLHTPWTVMASGLAKCIEVYMAVLAIRCALSFFPNIEWNQQPYSGLRDVCDPFLLFFQSIVPPVFDSLDISVSVGFMVLTVLVEILTARPF